MNGEDVAESGFFEHGAALIKEQVVKSRQSISNMSSKFFAKSSLTVETTDKELGPVSVLFDAIQEDTRDSPRTPGESFEESSVRVVAPGSAPSPKFEPSSWQSDKSWDRIPKSESGASIDDASLEILGTPDGEYDDPVIDDDEPRGRFKLLQPPVPGRPDIWIPYTQPDPAQFMTQDVFLEQEMAFESMGTSSLAAKKRARLQSIQLKCDMEAFKAANPGCIMEDFVAWHSPKDLVDSVLSTRMATTGNLWKELWKVSMAVFLYTRKRGLYPQRSRDCSLTMNWKLAKC